MQKKRKDNGGEIDCLLGKKLRYYRMQRNLTQGVLGKAVGVTPQQLQKYEKADNRMSASKLCLIAQYLQVPVAQFFEDSAIQKNNINCNNFLDRNAQLQKEVKNKLSDDSTPFDYLDEKYDNLESIRLIHAYHNIEDDRARSSIYYIIKSLARNKMVNNNDDDSNDSNKK